MSDAGLHKGVLVDCRRRLSLSSSCWPGLSAPPHRFLSWAFRGLGLPVVGLGADAEIPSLLLSDNLSCMSEVGFLRGRLHLIPQKRVCAGCSASASDTLARPASMLG